MQGENALAVLCLCAESSEHSLLPDSISTKVSYAGLFIHTFNILLSTLVDLLISLIIHRFYIYNNIMAAQWLSGRMLDSRPWGRASSVSLCCVLEQDTFILT